MFRYSVVLIALLFTWPTGTQAVDPYASGDPYWFLIHEPAVVNELKLSASQRQELQELTDGLDLRYFPLRNQSPEEATKGLQSLVREAQDSVKTILDEPQRRRLTQILLWRVGINALLRDEIAARVKLNDQQRSRIKEIRDTTQAATAALEKDASEGKPRESLENRFTELKTDEQKQILAVLKADQRTAWKELLGPAFDLSKLGQPALKAPELVDSKKWINSKSPLALEQLRGKVVVVHFYAHGCINCIHNYPWYRQWYDDYCEKDFVMIGIHTPETPAERDFAGVRRKATAEKLAFPILVDGEGQNWNAWGNSMWPSVYLIDKRGYLRHFWFGELKWQGNDGEKFMRERIDALMAESY
jgi:peroxiredoxin